MRKWSLAFAALLTVGWTAGTASAQTAPSPPAQSTTQQTTTTTTTTYDTDTNVNPADVGPNNQYGDPICGTWTNGTWQDNGHCPGYAVGPRRTHVVGTITAVKGHLVTVQQADKSLVINDQAALNNQQSGKVAVGRQIDAYGYWKDGNFYATQIVGNQPQ